MKNNQNLINTFEQAVNQMPLVAILRGVLPEEVCDIADILIESGFRMIEVPLNSPNPFQSISLLKKHCPENVLIGAGTVLDVESVKQLHKIEAELIVTPIVNRTVLEEINKYNFISLIGCMSPTEAFEATSLGANGIKIFPANAVDISYTQSLKSVLPKKTKIFAVGGIDLSNMQSFIQVGVTGFGLGSSLYKPGRSLEEIRQLAIAFTQKYKQTSK